MSGKPVIHEFIVVEGRDDTTAIIVQLLQILSKPMAQHFHKKQLKRLDTLKNCGESLFLRIQISQVKKLENKLIQRYQGVNMHL